MSETSHKLKDKLNSIPTLSGIYKMLDSNGNIIYVGKSISLRNRVRSYFVKNHKWKKVERMVSFIHDIDYIVTDTHLEARLLECELIKNIKPIYNSQFKNDERYVYLKLEEYNIHNPLRVVYQREENTYGPFRRKFSLIELINSFKNLYPIIKVNEGYDFEYKLFPISMDKDLYEVNKSSLQEIFSDDNNLAKLIDKIEEKMKLAASLLQFETATTYRNMIYSLNYLKGGIYGYKNMLSQNILLKIPTPSGVKLFFVSKGEVLLKESFPSLEDRDVDKFVCKGKDLISSSNFIVNEKVSMDFRDILYSEIRSLREEMVVILDA